MRPRIVRRWYVIPLTALVVCVIGIPVIWFSSGERFETTGRIRISPVMSSILFDDTDSERAMPNYESFVNTEAGRMTSPTVLNRVADELKHRNLTLFADSPDLVEVIQKAVKNETIIVAPEPHTEFVNIKMISSTPKEAEQVIDAIIKAYMTVVMAEEDNSSDSMLNVLDEQKRMLEGKITLLTQETKRLSDEYGTGELDQRQQMILQTVEQLQQDLIAVTVQRISQEIQVLVDCSDIPAEDHTERLNAYINSDPLVQTLTGKIADCEVLLVEGQSQTAEGDPSLQNTKETLEALTARLTEFKSQLTKQFQSDCEVERRKRRDRAILEAKAQLAHTKVHEKKLKEELEKYDTATTRMGRWPHKIGKNKSELERTRELYNAVCDRIAEIEIEQKRPARISVAETATSVPLRSRRVEKTVGTVLVGLLLGDVFAFIPWGSKGD